MEAILDHIQDTNGVELNRLIRQHAMPGFVKSAGDEAFHADDLPLTVYADDRPNARAYPCHTPASTWYSAIYFAEKKASHYDERTAARVQARLDDFADVWGIRSAVEEVRIKHARMNKKSDDSELPDSDFAVVWINADGGKERSFRMKNASEVKLAARQLLAHQDFPDFSFDDRRRIAERILEKAARFGAALDQDQVAIERQAGQGICDPKTVSETLYNRAKLARDEKGRMLMTKIAVAVAEKPQDTLNPDARLKLASAVDEFDAHIGLKGKYTAMIPRPEDFLFSVTYREVRACADGSVALTTGRVYDKSGFGKLALDSVQSVFGDDIANEVAEGVNVNAEKMAEVAGTFPRPDAELFESMLNELGIKPVSTKSASDRRPALSEELASAY